MEVLHVERKRKVRVKRSAWREEEGQVRRVSVFLPESHVRRLKATAARRGLTVTQLVVVWIDAHGDAAR